MADTKVINGVKTIDYRGKSYVEVAERLRHVHEQKRDFQVLESEVYEIAGRVLCRVTISVEGKIFKGTAEAKVTNAAPRSADATNPFECGETSALGRALAFAGFGTVDSIASYDEIARGLSQEEIAQSSTPAPAKPTQPTRPVPPQSPAPKATEPTPLNEIPTKGGMKRTIESGTFTDSAGNAIDWHKFVEVAFSEKISKDPSSHKKLLDLDWTPKYCEHAAKYLATLKKAA